MTIVVIVTAILVGYFGSVERAVPPLAPVSPLPSTCRIPFVRKGAASFRNLAIHPAIHPAPGVCASAAAVAATLLQSPVNELLPVVHAFLCGLAVVLVCGGLVLLMARRHVGPFAHCHTGSVACWV